MEFGIIHEFPSLPPRRLAKEAVTVNHYRGLMPLDRVLNATPARRRGHGAV